VTEQAHAVLYVVSSETGLDYDTFWADLRYLSERRTPFLLVINAAMLGLVALLLDGFRLDHCIGPSHQFWRVFRDSVKARKPGAVLVGEAWLWGVELKHLPTLGLRNKHVKWLLSKLPFYDLTQAAMLEYVGELDGCLDFTFQRLMREYVAQPTWSRPKWLLKWKLRRHYARFPDGYCLPTFLDNHDMDRFLYQCAGDKHRLREAARVQFANPQPPIIYYGTEVGMTQKESTLAASQHGDLQAREPMDWNPKSWDTELFKFYQRFIEKRRLHM